LARVFNRRSKPDRRSLFDRRSPCNRFFSFDRVSPLQRRSWPALLSKPDRIPSSVVDVIRLLSLIITTPKQVVSSAIIGIGASNQILPDSLNRTYPLEIIFDQSVYIFATLTKMISRINDVTSFCLASAAHHPKNFSLDRPHAARQSWHPAKRPGYCGRQSCTCQRPRDRQK